MSCTVMMSRCMGSTAPEADLLGEGNALDIHGALRVSTRALKSPLLMSMSAYSSPIGAVVHTRAATGWQNWFTRLSFERGGFGVFELAANAWVAHQAFDKIIDQAHDAGLLAQRGIQTGWGWARGVAAVDGGAAAGFGRTPVRLALASNRAQARAMVFFMAMFRSEFRKQPGPRSRRPTGGARG